MMNYMMNYMMEYMMEYMMNYMKCCCSNSWNSDPRLNARDGCCTQVLLVAAAAASDGPRHVPAPERPPKVE